MREARRKVIEKEILPDPPEKIDGRTGLIGWVNAALNKVPDYARDDARIELETYDDYGSIVREWWLHYWRYETEQEMKKRLADNERRKEQARASRVEARRRREAEELSAYKRLKAKFEGAA